MDGFLGLAKDRRSRREFSSRPVEFEKITELIRAATYAPSVGDLQPWRFIVVSDKGAKQSVMDHCPHQPWISGAPVLIVVCGSIGKVHDFYAQHADRWLSQTIGAVTQNMLLCAEEIGLGACWVSSFDEMGLRETLVIPDGHRPETIVALGYSNEVPRSKTLLPIDQITFLNTFGTRVTEMAAVLRDWGEHLRGKKNSFVEQQRDARTKRSEDEETKSFSDHAKEIFDRAKKSLKKED